jgi:GrpB-like predicted nucleotidyltransferase (UPF0157 family)
MLIQEYQAHWPQDFCLLRAELSSALKGLDTWVEHVGSTAVPQLAAKPILDIDVVHAPSVDFGEVKDRLTRVGYCHHGNQGIECREVFKRVPHLSSKGILDQIAHHLYVCSANSPELHRHLAFRDYLVAQPEARAAYQQLKYEIAQAANQDRKQYAALKEQHARAFIHDILAKVQIGGQSV